MMFEDKYKDLEVGETFLHEEDTIIKDRISFKCYICHCKTPFYSVLLRRYVCSEECLNEAWMELT